MRIPRFAVLFAVAELITPILCTAQSQTIESSSGTAYGTVLLATNHKPIERARVDFQNLSTGWEASTLTNANGKFDLAGLPLGHYRLKVIAPFCYRYEIEINVVERTGPLSLELDKSLQPATPVNDSVVSVDELKRSRKAEPAFTKGTKLLQKGDARKSLAYFEHALARDPGYYRAYHNLGLAQYLLGDKARAEESFQRAIDLTNGGYAPSQFALGTILLEERQYRQAEALIQNGLAMEPGSALGKYLLGLVQFASERLTDAERSAHDALFRSAGQTEAYILLAQIHARLHEPYSVEADVAAYLKLDGHGPLADQANLLLQRAQIEISKGAGSIR